MDKRWFELRGVDLPSDTTFVIACPMVVPSSWRIPDGTWLTMTEEDHENWAKNEKGSRWTRLPADGVFGYDKKKNTITVVDILSVKSYVFSKSGPENYNSFFKTEADEDEQRLKTIAEDLVRRGDSKSSERASAFRHEADALFTQRLFRNVKLHSGGAPVVPDPDDHYILVHASSSKIIADSDIGFVIPKPKAPSTTQTKESTKGKMQEK